MNITSGKLKLTIATVYLSLLFIGLYFLFSAIDLKDLTSYDFIRSNKDIILQYKEENFLFFVRSSCLYSSQYQYFPPVQQSFPAPGMKLENNAD